MFSPEEIDKTRQLLELFGKNDLAELSFSESDGFSVDIVAAGNTVPVTQQPYLHFTAAAPHSLTEVLVSSQTTDVPSSRLMVLGSPMVGVFYSSASPGDPPFVNVGDIVSVGQTIGLIEAMKVFSEIPAEASGRIVEIVAMSGMLVQQSDPLFRIEPV
jgi:acetyl-CoA carboxylase biotin carboxyl carrier protein